MPIDDNEGPDHDQPTGEVVHYHDDLPVSDSPCRVTFCSAPAHATDYDLVRGVCRWCREVIAEVDRQISEDRDARDAGSEWGRP